MVQLKDGDCASFQRNVIYLMILGEASACRGNPPAALWHCPKCSHCPCPAAGTPTHPQSCRQSRGRELWLPPSSCRELPLQEHRSPREQGSKKKGKMGWQSRCEKTVSETNAKARKQSLAFLFSLKKEQKQEQSWITLLFSPAQTEHQVENTTVLGWYKLSGQTKHERSLNSEYVFPEKALVFICAMNLCQLSWGKSITMVQYCSFTYKWYPNHTRSCGVNKFSLKSSSGGFILK